MKTYEMKTYEMKTYRMTITTESAAGEQVKVITAYGDEQVEDERDYHRGIAQRGSTVTITVEEIQ